MDLQPYFRDLVRSHRPHWDSRPMLGLIVDPSTAPDDAMTYNELLMNRDGVAFFELLAEGETSESYWTHINDPHIPLHQLAMGRMAACTELASGMVTPGTVSHSGPTLATTYDYVLHDGSMGVFVSFECWQLDFPRQEGESIDDWAERYSAAIKAQNIAENPERIECRVVQAIDRDGILHYWQFAQPWVEGRPSEVVMDSSMIKYVTYDAKTMQPPTEEYTEISGSWKDFDPLSSHLIELYFASWAGEEPFKAFYKKATGMDFDRFNQRVADYD